MERVGRFERFTTRWNESAQPVVDQFVDPKISARRWMRASRRRLRTMEDTARAFLLDVQTLEDADLGAMFGPVSRNLDQHQRVSTAISRRRSQQRARAAARV